MGLDRKLARAASRRLAGKTPSIVTVISDPSGFAKSLEGVKESARVVLAVPGELRALVPQAGATRETPPGLQYELERQRAVFMRFLIGNDSLLPPGPSGLAKFLTVENRYRAEYDALTVLVQLIQWAQEAP